MKAFVLAAAFLVASTSAFAGTLKSCDGVSTPQGFKYVGTYCYDYACSYTFTRTFDSYCPYKPD